jgi:protocatechuate 3,4-dioxygenase alpha subunit
MSFIPTSSQTVGPFFSIALERLCGENIVAADVSGERITIEGAVLDGDGAPVPDALLEIWQADGDGVYSCCRDASESATGNGFSGFGRVATDEKGRFRFVTVKPGCVRDSDGPEHAPHLVVSIFMRGLLTRLVTRIYFPDDARNAEDMVLRLVPADRRGTLMARAKEQGAGVFEWNIILQGLRETVFFEW